MDSQQEKKIEIFNQYVLKCANDLALKSEPASLRLKEAVKIGLDCAEMWWAQKSGAQSLLGKVKRRDVQEAIKRRDKAWQDLQVSHEEREIKDKEAVNLLDLYFKLFMHKRSRPLATSYLLDYILYGVRLRLMRIEVSVISRRELERILTSLRLLLEDEKVVLSPSRSETEVTRTRYYRLRKYLGKTDPFSDEFGDDSDLPCPVYVSEEVFAPLKELLQEFGNGNTRNT